MAGTPITHHRRAQPIPRPEYPRPQFRRSRWSSLNGEWAFAFDDDDVGRRAGWQNTSAHQLSSGSHPFDRLIVVPFCYQAAASGISDTSTHDVVWYARLFDLPCSFAREETQLLHFGAVDYSATVWVNGSQVARHKGGHTPFTADITHVARDRHNIVVIRVEDRWFDPTIPRGKQAWTEEPSHIFYTRTTGIWQSVWLEPVTVSHVSNFRVTPDIEGKCVELDVDIEGPISGLQLVLTVGQNGAQVARQGAPLQSATSKHSLRLTGNEAERTLALWSPEDPSLYDLRIELFDRHGTIVDCVDSYFGMRRIEAHDGLVYLNGRRLYQRLVLDQGYFPEGLLTAPSDDDLRRDIELAKAMGFCGARKHQKIEDPRWLYWADQLGFLVWSEMANAHQFSLESVRATADEWQTAVRRDYNHPCIIVWVPMNESWGSRRAADESLNVHYVQTLYHLTKLLDTTRLVVSNDGWEIVAADLVTIHDYGSPAHLFERFRTLSSALSDSSGSKSTLYPGFPYNGAPVIVSEFGGIAVESAHAEAWGYSLVRDSAQFLNSYDALVRALLRSPVVQGFCYTQLADVGQEINGLLTEAREPKCALEEIRQITGQDALSDRD